MIRPTAFKWTCQIGPKGQAGGDSENSKVNDVYFKKPLILAMVMFMLFQIYEVIHILMSWR
jgi:hypothetical protein